MAKKGKTKTSAVATLDPMVKTIIDQIRLAFHEKHKRTLNLDDSEIHALFEGEDFNDDDEFTKLVATEQTKLRKAMVAETTGDTGGVSRQELVDIANKDAVLQDIGKRFTEAKDFAAKAPASMAWRILRDYTPAQRRAFAIPMSDQKTHKDARGNDIGENMRKGYRWDKYYAKSVTGETIEGSWYQDFADDTITGQYLVATRNALQPSEMHEGKDNVPVTIDGITMDVLRMEKSQRDNLYRMLGQRRTDYAKAYRNAMQCLNAIDEINTRVDNIKDKDGKITRYGTVHAGFALLDFTQPDKGLSPSRKPIRLTHLYQDDVKDPVAGGILYNKGMLSNEVRDLAISEIINLDIDKAFVSAGKADRTMPNINEVVSSKYVRKETTPAGDKQAATTTAGVVELPTAKATFQAFHNIRLQLENPGYIKAYDELMTPGQLPDDQLRIGCYDMVELLNFLSSRCTKEVLAIHDQIQKETEDAIIKEKNEKLAKLKNVG